MAKKIKVPDIEQFSANLCLKQQIPSMGRCDRKAGHGTVAGTEHGHSWEMAEEIKRLRGLLHECFDPIDQLVDLCDEGIVVVEESDLRDLHELRRRVGKE